MSLPLSEAGWRRDIERRLRELETSTRVGNTAIVDGALEIRDGYDRPVLRLGKQRSGLYGLAALDSQGREIAYFGQLDSSELGAYPHEDKYGAKVLAVTDVDGASYLLPVFETSSTEGMKWPVIAQGSARGQPTRVNPGENEAVVWAWAGSAVTASAQLLVAVNTPARLILRRRRSDGSNEVVLDDVTLPGNSSRTYSIPADQIGRLQHLWITCTATGGEPVNFAVHYEIKWL